MKPNRFASALAGLGLLGALSGTARADFASPRFQVAQKGDIVLLGNTLGFDCAGGAGIPAPVVGTVGACGLNTADAAMDVYWRSDSPAAGQAVADLTVTFDQARSSSVFVLPAGATVTKAFLYWSAEIGPPGVPDPQVTLSRQGGFSTNVNAIQSYLFDIENPVFYYQSVADVTAIVQAQGPGAYRVSGVDSKASANVNDGFAYSAWWMAVFYTVPGDPLRTLSVYDGLSAVFGNPGVTTTLSGFVVPNGVFDAKLGVIAFEGDKGEVGDEVRFKGTALTNALNPANDFFNGTRSSLGVAVSNAGDLPQLTGAPSSLAGLDLDIVDVKGLLNAGDVQAQVQTNNVADFYLLGGLTSSIQTGAPDFSTSPKTAVDLNGGSLLPGDTIQYTIVATNSGSDASINTVLTDVIPAGLTYLPGSIQITAGPNAGGKTDAAGDDQGEYNAATHTVTVRLGAGAGGAIGGTILAGASTTVKFIATVNANTVGDVSNQATINGTGQMGAPASDALTDGNAGQPGAQPTTVTVDQCISDLQCSPAKPHCFVTPTPNVCVECFLDNQCGALKPTCSAATNTCTCVPTGPEVCGNNLDDDCDGAIDNGCVGCVNDASCGGANSGKICNAAKFCVDGCRGMGGNACPNGKFCTSVDATPGLCVQCLADADCGGAMSGTVCDNLTHVCEPGCRGMGGNGCMAGSFCSSMDATIGQCFGCLADANCGGAMSGTVCDNLTHVCEPGCRGMGGNGCMAGSVCSSMDASIGQCFACLVDADCGGAMSGTVCDDATHACKPGCRGVGGNGCMAGKVCTSMDAIIGQCLECLTDSDCGGPMSAKVCDGSSSTCIDGCRGVNGNGCMAGDTCTSMDATIGQCVQCLVDADCGGPMSAKVCDGMMCKDGCRGMGGNGCMAGSLCTSMDATIGVCVQCLVDADCGGPMSAKVCDGMVCKDGCRGMGGNGCMAGKDCTSKDATIGVCVECLTDSECGDAKSGKVCDDATHMCGPGCRGKGGNGCPDGQNCSSKDETIGICAACASDADCGEADSGKVCDDTSRTCVPGCRGMGGNGCSGGLKCSSLTNIIGSCQGCTTDADCGTTTSGKVCDDKSKICVDGCRGRDGNGCASEQTCSSKTAEIGTCKKAEDDVVGQGDGILCSTLPGSGRNEGTPWLLGGALGLLLAWRRRRAA